MLPSLLAFALAAADAPKVEKITYDDHVRPLLIDKCLACHNADKKSSRLNLSSYVKLREGGSGGEVVKPGDPDNSPIYLMTAHKQEPFMPPKSAVLPQASLD